MSSLESSFDYENIVEAVNVSFLLTMAIIIFIMQAGFAFLEAGSVRAKNTTNIIMKNIIDAGVGALGYWATGYAFSLGSNSNPFIGTNRFFLINTPDSDYVEYFVGYVFALTSSTIVSGALAERARIYAYILFTVFMVMFVYPVVVHWVWSDAGWLHELGYHDFAGSSVVHCVGGAAAVSGALLLGPRIGRFKNGKVQPIPGHSVVLLALGFFLLWFGFFAFNASSEGGILGDGYSPRVVGRAVVNTALSASGAIISSLLLGKMALSRQEIAIFGKEMKVITIFGGFWSVNGAVNGGITGMVAICASCDVVEPWAAFVIGVVAGILYLFSARFVIELQIDDPVSAIAIHLFGGVWGVIAVALFASQNKLEDSPDGGILYAWNGDAFILMGIQMIGVATIIAWSFCWTFLLFGILRVTGQFRVTAEQENDGLDFVDGEPAYPMDPAVLAGFNSSDFSDEGSEAQF